ncbi:hypothetical protein OG618_00225 [Kitasatospora sp. NBC_01246]|uniref:hypothetical protein n=1 Tax=Kitasatospora sp. NBC_01246 TaxID=2903570 RepID=UPI002E305A13|nr:hypothetical protein [Kitasatospora sp. NBC_01246]
MTEPTEPTGTPRALRISFEFEVPRGLKRNIHGAKIQKALDTISDRVIGLAEGLFPWAAKVTVRKQWVYNWTDDTDTYELPANADNTPE